MHLLRILLHLVLVTSAHHSIGLTVVFDFLGQADDASTGLDMADVFNNLALQIDPIKTSIVLCYVVGVGLSIAAVMKLKKYGTRTAFMSVEMSMVGPFYSFL